MRRGLPLSIFLLLLLTSYQNCGEFKAASSSNQVLKSNAPESPVKAVGVLVNWEFPLNEGDNLFVGQLYRISIPTVKLSGLPSPPKVEFATIPQNACVLTDASTSTLLKGNLVCTMAGRVDLRVTIPSKTPSSGFEEIAFSKNIVEVSAAQSIGRTVYQTHCASCHGAIDQSTKKGHIATSIATAIFTQPSMTAVPTLQKLTMQEVLAIEAALDPTLPVTATPTPAPQGTPIPSSTPDPVLLQGATLFTQLCSSCHGSIFQTNKRPRTAAQISGAISSVQQMKIPSLQGLSAAQISAIAAALQ